MARDMGGGRREQWDIQREAWKQVRPGHREVLTRILEVKWGSTRLVETSGPLQHGGGGGGEEA